MTIASPTRPTPPLPPRGNPPMSHMRSMKPTAMAASIDPIRVLRRHMTAIIGSIVVGGIVGVAAYFGFMQFYPLYSAQVVFEVQPALQDAGQVGTLEWANDDMVYRIAQTESYMLISREILDTAMNSPEILRTDWHKKFVEKTSDGAEAFQYADAVDKLRKEIRAGPVRGSNLFSLRWSTHSKRDVPIVLNAIARTYEADRAAKDQVVYGRNLDLFQARARATETELADLMQKMKSMIRAANMTDIESVWRTAQAYRSQELTKQLAEASAALSIAQTNQAQVAEQLRGNLEPTSMDYYEAENDRSVIQLIEYIQFQAGEVRRLKETRPPGDVLVLNGEEKLRGLEAQRDVKVKEIITRNLEARFRQHTQDVDRFTSTLQKLEKDLDELTKTLRDLSAEQAEYLALVMRQEHLEAKRTADLQLINELNLMRARADASRVRLAQGALEPRELAFPKPEIVIPLGVLVVLGLTIGVVFLRELLDQRVKSPSDLTVLPGANVLGSIPDLSDEPAKIDTAELVVRTHPLSVMAESYRQTAAALWPMLDRNLHQSLLLMGGLPGSGTTTVATNLAATAAAAGRRVIVIDANFRRPGLASAMGANNECPGLADVISGAARLDQVITDVQGIAVITAGTPAHRISERLNTSAVDSMLAELRGKYDLIIFDAPPAVVAGDAMTLANKVDAAVIVVRAHQEHRGLVSRMIHRLADARCELQGLILNRPRGVAGGYLKKNYATMAGYTAQS